MAFLLKNEKNQISLDKLGGVSEEFVEHRQLALTTREEYRSECKKARRIAEQIQNASENKREIAKQKELLKDYQAHYSFDFSQSLWLPQMADTPGQFDFLSLRSINLFGIVDVN